MPTDPSEIILAGLVHLDEDYITPRAAAATWDMRLETTERALETLAADGLLDSPTDDIYAVTDAGRRRIEASVTA